MPLMVWKARKILLINSLSSGTVLQLQQRRLGGFEVLARLGDEVQNERGILPGDGQCRRRGGSACAGAGATGTAAGAGRR